MSKLRSNDEKRQKGYRRPVDWFSTVLGEDWVTEGDGIYRRAPEPNSVEEHETDRSSLDELNDALAPGARLEPEVESPAGDNNEPSTGRRGEFWRR